MAQLTQFYPTDAGRALLAIASTGACKLEISKGQVSDGTDAIDVLKTKETLTGNVKDMPIISKERVDEHNTVISTSISNVGVTTAFSMREYGLYAKAYNADGTPVMDGENQKEILFVVATDSDPDILYQAGSTPITLQLDVTLTFDGDMEVTVTVDPAGLVTIRKLDQHNTDATAHANLLRVTGMTETDNGIQYTTQDKQTHDLNILQRMKPNFVEKGGVNLWNALHSDVTIPTTADATSLDWAKLGLFSKYFTQENSFPNQPSQYGQLINIPASLSGEATQLWLEQASGSLYFRGGNVSNQNMNTTPFTKVLTTADQNPIASYDVSNANAWWVKFAGKPGLIIQGVNGVTNPIWPIKFPNACLSFAYALSAGTKSYNLYTQNIRVDNYSLTGANVPGVSINDIRFIWCAFGY